MTTNTKSTYAELHTMCLGILQDLEDAQRALAILSEYSKNVPNWLLFEDADEEAQDDRRFFLDQFGQYVECSVHKDDGAPRYELRLSDDASAVADAIREVATSCLDLTYCKNVKGDGNDYCSILFTCGGPHIEAVRYPGQSHFEIRGSWGSDSYSWPDLEDVIPGMFAISDLAASY